MLAKLGCDYVLAGHSERRQYHHEDDALVNAKVKAALGAEITPIMCVGEALEIRQQGRQVEHCVSQVTGSLAGIPAEQVAGMVIAYEPVWAIGTGEVATPEMPRRPAGQLESTFLRFTGARRPIVCVSCMAGRLSTTTSHRSWLSRMSTVPSSEEPALMPLSSPGSAGFARSPRRLPPGH